MRPLLPRRRLEKVMRPVTASTRNLSYLHLWIAYLHLWIGYLHLWIGYPTHTISANRRVERRTHLQARLCRLELGDGFPLHTDAPAPGTATNA